MGTMCIFPGQGSQSVGMLDDLAAAFPQVKETYAEASETLGFDLWELVHNGPKEVLDSTENTQPALLAASTAIWRVLASQVDIHPLIMAGHSFGEYSALVAAGAIPYAQTVALARKRGALMQSAVAEGAGAMAAILGLEDAQIEPLCQQQSTEGQVVEGVNFNALGQVVVAGHRSAVEKLVELAKEAGAKRAIVLPVSVPAHSSLMKPAAEAFAQELQNVSVQSPQIKVVQNADTSMHADPAEIRQALCEQLYRPVRWVDTIQQMTAMGVAVSLEIGPGKVLTGLNKRINKSLTSICVCDPATIEQAVSAIEENP